MQDRIDYENLLLFRELNNIKIKKRPVSKKYLAKSYRKGTSLHQHYKKREHRLREIANFKLY
jgi:hypothetical protein